MWLDSWRTRFAAPSYGALGPCLGQTLANDAAHQFASAAPVINAVGLTVVMAELKFNRIAAQMLLAAMLIDALHTAFEDRKRAFDSVVWIVRPSRSTDWRAPFRLPVAAARD